MLDGPEPNATAPGCCAQCLILAKTGLYCFKPECRKVEKSVAEMVVGWPDSCWASSMHC